MPELVVTTADGYTTANTYGPFPGASLTSVQAWTNPIALQLFYGPQGSSALTSEETLVPGIIQQYEGATGARVRSQTSGAPATVKINVYLPGTGQAGGLPQPLTPVTAGGGPGSFNITVGGSPVTVDNNLPIVVNNSISDPVNVTVPVTETVNVNVVSGSFSVTAGESASTTLDLGLTNVAVAVNGNIAGHLTGWFVQNLDFSENYLLFYDVASGSVTVGATTPKMVLWVPLGGGLDSEALLAQPIKFTTAITAALVTLTGAATVANLSGAPGTAGIANFTWSP